MNTTTILVIFLILRLGQHLVERYLAHLNRQYYMDEARQKHAAETLGISAEDMAKTVAYTADKAKFGQLASWVSIVVFLSFLAVGGLGLFERIAIGMSDNGVVQGLAFFGLFGLTMMIFNLPFDYYRTFVIEERHGFNRQTVKGFFLDRVKGIGIGVVLGGLVMAMILGIMGASGHYWWVWAWFAMSGFSILTAWLYPTLLAPLFNKFKPLEEGELKTQIDALAQKIGFQTDGLFVMDASTRSSHGNAYFTGVFGKKRIVLFDTLVESLNAEQVVAVLAHELGHFKLHHVRWALIRSVAMTGITFYLLSLALPLERFYQAFGLSGISNYGALLVFGLWFGVIDFLLQPMENFLSRRNEFAADAFAKANVPDFRKLGEALLKLREKSQVMPLSHPMFSRVYHSHPPILERLEGMGFLKG